MSDVPLVSPLSGWLMPLDEVPDPVFAERMMGEGLAIDPTSSVVCAPADGIVIAIPETAHAVTIRLANGGELLIHVGLETVALGGAGFKQLCKAGARVKPGDPLIEIDLNRVARGAKSLVTPIIVASDGYALELDRLSRRIAEGEPIGIVRSRNTAEEVVEASSETHELNVTIGAAHGLHARPAARIAALLRGYSAEVNIAAGERPANARSVVALLGAGLRRGDEVRVSGRGADAQSAVEAVVALIEGGLGESDEVPLPTAPVAGPAAMCASPGLAVGEIVQLRLGDVPVPRDGGSPPEEQKRLESALALAASSLTQSSTVGAELAEAHRALVEDPDLLERAQSEIAAGRSAAFAWRTACEAARAIVRSTGDALLIERAADILDVERRVIGLLVGETPAMLDLKPRSILVAEDLLPSQFMAADKSKLAGICTARGGPTSHAVILAASAGVPMIINAGDEVLDLADGETAILDADHGRMEVAPTADRLAEVEALLAERHAQQAAEARDANDPCFTADGVRIEVFANLASVEDARAAVAVGAEGCGLLRTEFLFLDRSSAPSEDEQRSVYASIADALGGRPLIVRTLDIGADKPVPYVAVADEENPALGLRGIRLCFARPDLLCTQLSAIVAGVPAEQCRIMLPMITEVDELRQARQLLGTVQQSLGLAQRIPLGVMIETPAAAMLAKSIAAEADFFSLGTNDLTQYALAADRGNAAVATMVDALHPAVLRLIREAARGAAAHARPIGICGALASDPMAAAILIGLGITELSVVPAAVPKIKAAVRRLSTRDGELLAERACAASSAGEVRALAAGIFE